MKRKKKKRVTKKPVTRRVTKKKRRRNPRQRNPIVGDMAMELTYLGGEGKRKGKMKGPWVHEFESGDVTIEGLPDGSIKLISKSGKRLWDFFEV